VVAGGAGSAVIEALAEDAIATPVLTLGLPDAFIQHGDPQQLIADAGLDAAGIARAVRERLSKSDRRSGKAA
jgi:1-deoxy-D-xylulose-5-phosphate synthase